MKAETLDIDAIVREVLAQLAAAAPSRSSSAPATNSSASSSLNSSPSSATTPPVASNMAVNDAVVTVAVLEARANATTRTVTVGPRAVVTPAARDWLRAKAIELSRSVASAPAAAKPAAIGKVYLHATSALGTSRSWTRRILEAGWELESLVPCAVVQAAAELSAVLGPRQRLGVLLTHDVAAAVCLANRHANVRAALAASVEEVRSAVAQIHANLLVVEPRLGDFAVRRIVQEFLRTGPRDAPAAWRGAS